MMLLQSQDEIEKCKGSTAFSAFYWLAVNSEKVAPKVKFKILTRMVKYAISQKKKSIDFVEGRKESVEQVKRN